MPSASLARAISFPPPDVLDLLHHLCAVVQERFQTLPDVVDVPVRHGARHPLTVAFGIETHVLASNSERDGAESLMPG